MPPARPRRSPPTAMPGLRPVGVHYNRIGAIGWGEIWGGGWIWLMARGYKMTLHTSEGIRLCWEQMAGVNSSHYTAAVMTSKNFELHRYSFPDLVPPIFTRQPLISPFFTLVTRSRDGGNQVMLVLSIMSGTPTVALISDKAIVNMYRRWEIIFSFLWWVTIVKFVCRDEWWQTDACCWHIWESLLRSLWKSCIRVYSYVKLLWRIEALTNLQVNTDHHIVERRSIVLLLLLLLCKSVSFVAKKTVFKFFFLTIWFLRDNFFCQ